MKQNHLSVKQNLSTNPFVLHSNNLFKNKDISLWTIHLQFIYKQDLTLNNQLSTNVEFWLKPSYSEKGCFH